MHRGTREGSLVALSATGGVITSAGLVLAATFLVLGSMPLVFLAELGVAVALGVLLDTMIVRSVLVTALNLDLGGKIWWPSRLDRPAPSADPEPGAGARAGQRLTGAGASVGDPRGGAHGSCLPAHAIRCRTVPTCAALGPCTAGSQAG